MARKGRRLNLVERRARGSVSHITDASPDQSFPFPRVKEDALHRD